MNVLNEQVHAVSLCPFAYRETVLRLGPFNCCFEARLDLQMAVGLGEVAILAPNIDCEGGSCGKSGKRAGGNRMVM